MFWSLKDLYKAFALTSYQGKSSDWVDRGRKRWEAFLEEVFGSGHVVLSNHGNTRREGAVMLHQCLPSVSVSTCALLMLLQRWSFLAQEKGGLSSDAAKENAMELFLRLNEPLLNMSGTVYFSVHVDDRWKSTCPRPWTSERATNELSMAPGGILEWMPLVLIQASGDAVAALWWKLLQTCLAMGSTQQSVGLFFSQTAHIVGLQSLRAQVAMQLATGLEDHCARSSKTETGALSSHLSIRWKSQEEVMEENIDASLCGYQLSCIEHSHGHSLFHFATDKVIVHGLPLIMSFMTVPTNLGMICIPQALLSIFGFV